MPRRLAKDAPIIMTIGHSTRTIEAFVEMLAAHGVRLVIDIRSIPRSRHNPQFNKDALPASLKAARIGYRHMPALGGLRHARPDSPNTAWRNASFRGFADYMLTEECATALEKVIGLAKKKRAALLCAEAVPWRCHRSLVADALEVKGVRVLHLTSRTGSRPHRRTYGGSVIRNPRRNKGLRICAESD